MIYLVHELNKQGVNQWIACRKGSKVEAYCKEHGLQHQALSIRAGMDPFFARAVHRFSQSRNVQLIHTHDSHAHTTAVLMHALYVNKAPIIVSRRVDFPISSSWMSRYKYNHSGVGSILCVSDAIKGIMARDIQAPEKLQTVHSGIDLERFHSVKADGRLREALGIDTEKLLIGNVAALAPHKDLFTFIDTVAVLKSRGLDAHYAVIGEGPMEREVKDYASAKQLNTDITFTGFRDDIPHVLPELDVFLITSETEGLGTSVLDAFACKVPVVATAAGGIPEMVEHRKTGMLGGIKNPTELADAVESLINEKGLCDEVVRGATTKLTEFTTGATARKTLEVYRNLVKKPSSGG